jgi:hypothetical protein
MNRAQRALLGERLLAANRDAVPGLHAAAQGIQRLFALGEFRSGRCGALGVRGAVERGGEEGVGADVEVLLLDVVDELVFLDICEERGLDLCEGV